jgi:hypothetical protein
MLVALLVEPGLHCVKEIAIDDGGLLVGKDVLCVPTTSSVLIRR